MCQSAQERPEGSFQCSLLCRKRGAHEKLCSLPPTQAIQVQSAQLSFSHLKKGQDGAWVWAPWQRHTLPHQITQVPLPEPIHTPLAAVGCARAISEGLCPGCHSGREWLDHTHYICVSVHWCQLAACVVDPISKAPDSQLHQGREGCTADQR